MKIPHREQESRFAVSYAVAESRHIACNRCRSEPCSLHYREAPTFLVACLQQRHRISQQGSFLCRRHKSQKFNALRKAALLEPRRNLFQKRTVARHHKLYIRMVFGKFFKSLERRPNSLVAVHTRKPQEVRRTRHLFGRHDLRRIYIVRSIIDYRDTVFGYSNFF